MAYKTHFKDRIDAGKYLASLLTEFKNKPNTIVVGIPRGGVILSHEIAKELNIPEDIIVVRKVGCPGQPEFGIGAISQTGNVVLDHHTMQRLGIKEADIADTIHKETLEAQRRLKVYREGRGPLDLKNKVVLLVDDGIATGHTTRAAVSTAKSLGAKSIVVVAPVAPRDATLKSLGADRAVVPWVPLPGQFWAVGQAYEHFGQTEDEEVIACMRELTGTGQDLRKSDGGEHSSRVYLQHSA